MHSDTRPNRRARVRAAALAGMAWVLPGPAVASTTLPAVQVTATPERDVALDLVTQEAIAQSDAQRRDGKTQFVEAEACVIAFS